MSSLSASGSVIIRRGSQSAYRLTSELTLRRPIEEVFEFFSDARNLEELTPPWLRFRVVTSSPVVMARGARIDYRLRIHGVPLRWTSEIDTWEPPVRFVDRQHRGPYRLWIHSHTFAPVDGGTLVSDQVDYASFGGRVVSRLVSRDLSRVFEYRHAQLRAIFG